MHHNATHRAFCYLATPPDSVLPSSNTQCGEHPPSVPAHCDTGKQKRISDVQVASMISLVSSLSGPMFSIKDLSVAGSPLSGSWVIWGAFLITIRPRVAAPLLRLRSLRGKMEVLGWRCVGWVCVGLRAAPTSKFRLDLPRFSSHSFALLALSLFCALLAIPKPQTPVAC